MLLNKVLLFLASLSMVLSYPLTERSQQSDELILSRFANVPTLPPSAKRCKKVQDCKCPEPANPNVIHSTSCINGFCSCDNPVVNFVGGKFIDAVAAVGKAAITKAIGQLMQGLADATQVASIIAGALLGPVAKKALKVALLAFPDTGPSHVDQATKGILTKVLG